MHCLTSILLFLIYFIRLQEKYYLFIVLLSCIESWTLSRIKVFRTTIATLFLSTLYETVIKCTSFECVIRIEVFADATRLMNILQEDV